jgi:hypothetical protein
MFVAVLYLLLQTAGSLSLLYGVLLFFHWLAPAVHLLTII